MTDDDNDNHSDNATPKSDEQPDEVTEANKPSDARAKGEPKAGNILGGVQSE